MGLRTDIVLHFLGPILSNHLLALILFYINYSPLLDELVPYYSPYSEAKKVKSNHNMVVAYKLCNMSFLQQTQYSA